MLAHQSLPTLQCEKPCFNAHKVKRQVMYTKHIIPSYNSCISLSGTLRHTTAVHFALRKRHTTLCMRFSSSTSPFPHAPQHRSYCTRSTFPYSEKHDTRALHPYKADIACIGYCSRSVHAYSSYTPEPILELTPRLGTYHHWQPAPNNIFCLNRPYNRGTRGHLAWDLPIPDALSSHDELQSYFKAVSSTRSTRVYIIYR